MNIIMLLFTLLVAGGGAGCSSVSLPSMPSLPSLPWSGTAAKPDATAEQLFEVGNRNFNEKKYARAIDAFAKIKTDHPFSPVITQTELKIADAYYLNQQYPEAINAFKEFQSLHPTNENMPFVVYRLGQAHFDQFSSADRDQKNTQIAKGYFETVLSKFPQSPYAAEAKQKIAKCIEYISEYDFNVAYFYFQQEKYPAARDRFEEIIRRYQGAPAAVKSLFFLGESYRAEKNIIKAALAYEALIQHYPQSKFAAEARNQLAQLGKEKNDPLAMLLMRDRRPTASPPTEKTETVDARLKDVELIAKNDIVFEEPGDEKSLFRRVVDKINPFSDDDKKKSPAKAPVNRQEPTTTKKAGEKKEESPGLIGSLWSGINPFRGRDSDNSKKTSDSPKDQPLVNQIDDSLERRGVDTKNQLAALKPPAAALPPEPPAPVQTMDTGKLIGEIDSNLKKSGTEVKELTPPKAAEAFTNPTVIEAALAAKKPPTAGLQDSNTSDLLSSIDQNLNRRGVKSADFEAPPTPSEIKERSANQPPPKKDVELEPKLALEKGPLYLSPVETQGISGARAEPSGQETKPENEDKEPATRGLTKALVKGPTPAQPATAKPEEKKPVPVQDQENQGAFEQLRQDLDNIGKLLNPFRW